MFGWRPLRSLRRIQSPRKPKVMGRPYCARGWTLVRPTSARRILPHRAWAGGPGVAHFGGSAMRGTKFCGCRFHRADVKFVPSIVTPAAHGSSVGVYSMTLKLAALVTAIAFCAGTMTNAVAFSRSGHEGLQNGRVGGLAHGRTLRPGVHWETGEHHGVLSRWGVGRLGVFGYDDRPWVR